jgi:hypothetical protein
MGRSRNEFVGSEIISIPAAQAAIQRSYLAPMIAPSRSVAAEPTPKHLTTFDKWSRACVQFLKDEYRPRINGILYVE